MTTRRWHKFEANYGNILDQGWMTGVAPSNSFIDLFNMNIHYTRITNLIVIPNFKDQVNSPPDLIGIAGKTVEELEF